MSKISDDISKLREDVSTLFSHTGRHTLPEGAHHLADYGRHKLHAGGALAASGIQYLKENPKQSSAGLAGGLLLLGAVGFGIYYLCKSECTWCKKTTEEDEESAEPGLTPSSELPSYIS
ncbi:hypothetical protein [Luteolibacter sp. AS25]|uniref:hypothetical protein n=1 Tax=Luteolibacter sp. AS25 TaxID=3135776 RepID=UPI00398AFB4B